jgi:ABC-type amino acid transport substrate-binding protein
MKRFVIFHILFLVIINLYAFEDLSKEEMQYLSVNKEIIFTGQTNYQPFEFLNDKGEYTGLTIDIIKHIAKLYNFKVKFIPQSFFQAQQTVLNDSADVITSFFYSVERDQKFDFTNLLFEVPAYIFISNERTDISKLYDLRGKIIAMQKGDFAESYLKNNHITCDIIFTDNFKNAVSLVAEGKADALIGDEQITKYHIYKNNLSRKIKRVGIPLYVGKDCMAVKNNNRILVSILNKGIAYCRNTGYINKSYQKWIGLEYKIFDDDILLFVFLGIVIFILIFIIFRMKQLNLKKRSFLTKEILIDRLNSENTISFLYHKAGCCETHTFLHGNMNKYTEFNENDFYDNFWEKWKIVVHSEDRDLVPDFEELLKHRNMNFAYRIETDQGEIRWFKTNTFLMRYDEQIKNLIIISIDITDLIKI